MNIQERERVSAAESARRTAHEPGYIAVRDRAEVRRGRRAARRHEEQMFRARARVCCVCVHARTQDVFAPPGPSVDLTDRADQSRAFPQALGSARGRSGPRAPRGVFAATTSTPEEG